MSLRQKKLFLFTGAPVVALFLIWGFLFLPHLRSNPSWFMDETKALDCSINLVQGSPNYLATWNTFFHPVTSYQPPYLFLNGLFAKNNIWGGRFFNTLLALAIGLLLFIWGRRFLGYWGAFFSAIIFLTYSQTLIHFRSVYPHNGVALGTIIAALALSSHFSKKKDWLAGGGLSIAAGSHPMFIYPAIAAWIARWKRPASWIRLFFPALIYFGITFALVYWRFGDWLLQDIQELARWYTQDSAEQGGHFFKTLFRFYSTDWFHIGGILGMILCFRKRVFVWPVFIIVISALLFQNREFFVDFYYSAVLLIPLLCLCWGRMIQKTEQILRKRSFSILKNILFLTFFLFLLFQGTRPIWITHLDKEQRHDIVQKAELVDTIANWLNNRTSEEDIVIANSNIGWRLKAKAVHYLQTSASDDMPALYYRNKNIPQERCLYEISLNDARYMVISQMDMMWEPSKNDIEFLMKKIKELHWKKVVTNDDYVIFINPNLEKEEIQRKLDEWNTPILNTP